MSRAPISTAGIADVDDDCQASLRDDEQDVDADGKRADVDLCPHDKNAVSGDLDLDGIPDACDPFFDMVRPDTRRCVTSFAVRWRTASYLAARADEQTWNLAWPLTATATETVSVVSTLELDHPSTSFDLLATASFANADEGSAFVLWLRAGETPSDRDVGCGVDGGGNLFVWAGNTRQAVKPLPPIAGPFRLRATVGGLRARCCAARPWTARPWRQRSKQHSSPGGLALLRPARTSRSTAS